MRHVQLKPVQVHQTGEGIESKKKSHIYTGVSMMHNSVYPVCKEFFGQLPKPLYHNLLHTII